MSILFSARRLVALISASLLVAIALPAQSPLVGSRLRAWTSDSTRIIGVRVAGPQDSLVLRPDPRRLGAWTTHRLALTDVQRLDVSRGRVLRPGAIVGGAVLGALTGIAMGALIEHAFCLNANGCPTSTGVLARGAAMMAAGGALLGAVSFRGDRWERVP